MNYRTHAGLEPLVQPMYYSNPEESEAYEVPNQYWFGSELVVAPITKKRDSVSLLGKTVAWLPEGDWFDFFTGDRYQGGKQEIYRTMDKYPVFAKAGAIVPLNKFRNNNELGNFGEIDILVFPAANGKFTLYQDEGDGCAYQNGKFSTTEFSLNWKKREFKISAAKGDLKNLPNKRTYNIALRSVIKGTEIKVYINGAEAGCSSRYDSNTHSVLVTVTAGIRDEVTVKLQKGDIVYRNGDVLDRAFDILMHAQLDYDTKEKLWLAVQNPNGGNMMVRDPNLEPLMGALKEIVSIHRLSK